MYCIPYHFDVLLQYYSMYVTNKQYYLSLMISGSTLRGEKQTSDNYLYIYILLYIHLLIFQGVKTVVHLSQETAAITHRLSSLIRGYSALLDRLFQLSSLWLSHRMAGSLWCVGKLSRLAHVSDRCLEKP